MPADPITDAPSIRRGAISRPRAISAGIIGLLVALAASLWWLNRPTSDQQQALLVYCAVSMQPALRSIGEAYKRETGRTIDLQTGSSGALETQIRLSQKGDLFIPAAEEPYLRRCRIDGVVNEIVPLVDFHLVLALNPNVDAAGVSLGDVIGGQLRSAIANEQAAAGHLTRTTLEEQGKWQTVEASTRVFLPTVTAVAEAVQLGTAADAGFVWNTTAQQFGLTIVHLPELADARATVSAGLLACSKQSDHAVEFITFLTTSDEAHAVFEQLGYTIAEHN